MTFNDYGETLEERVKSFQGEMMWHAIFSSLFFIFLKGMLVSLFGLNDGVLLTVIFTMVYFYYIKSYYKGNDIHSGKEIYTYKGLMYHLREDEPSEVTLQLEQAVIKGMIITSSAFFGVGSFVEDFIVYYAQDGGWEKVVLAMALGLFSSFPLGFLYMYMFVKTSKLYTVTIMSPAFGVEYVTLMKQDASIPDSTEYLDWKGLTKRKRKKVYSKSENDKFKELHKTLTENIEKNTRILSSAFGAIREIDATSNDEMESKVKEHLKGNGHKVNVKVTGIDKEDYEDLDELEELEAENKGDRKDESGQKHQED